LGHWLERLSDSPIRVLTLLFVLSLLLYVLVLALPYNLFTYAGQAPISLGEIAERSPLSAAVFGLTFLVLFALYALAYRLCRRQPDARLLPLILFYGLAMALALGLTYPIGAGDVIDYISYGEELARFGTNPLVVPPASIPDMAFAPYSAYRNAVSNYGPLWTWISALIVDILGTDSLALTLVGFKGVAILAYLAQGWIVAAILQRRDAAQAPAGVLLFAWNPLILYECAVNGHNDAAMMALALLGILLWQRERPFLAAGAFTLSFLIKIPTLPLLPLFLLAAARRRRSARGLVLTVAGGGLLSLALVVLGYASLPDGARALLNLSSRSDLFTHSLPTVIYLTLRLGGVEKLTAQQAVRTAALLVLWIWYVIQIARTWRKPDRALQSAYDFLLFWLLFATLWFQPWYVTWLVALAALLPGAGAALQAGLFSLTVFSSYIVYGFLWFWIIPSANWANGLGITLIAVATTYLPPWAYTAWLHLRPKKTGSK